MKINGSVYLIRSYLFPPLPWKAVIIIKSMVLIITDSRKEMW